MTARTLTLNTTTRTGGHGILAWLVDADRRYRAACHLRGLSDDMLGDAGLSRPEAETLARVI